MGGVDTAPEMERMTDMRVYADQAATTSLSKTALEAMLPWMTENFGNPSALYEEGRTARDAVETAREKIAHLLHAKAKEIYFTSGGTEADNWALQMAAAAGARIGKKHIIVSAIEHHAVLNPAKSLERQGFRVTYLPVTSEGLVLPEALEAAICPDTALVSVMYANNEVGTIQPVEELAAICRMHGVWFHTDAVQAAGHVEIDLTKLQADFLSVSAHKFHGPKGCGFLYVKNGFRTESLLEGGAQEKGKRAGTENVPGIVGMAAALEESLINRDKKDTFVLELRRQVGIELCPVHGHSPLSFEKSKQAANKDRPLCVGFRFGETDAGSVGSLCGNVLVNDALDGAVVDELLQSAVDGVQQSGVALGHADGVVLVGILGVQNGQTGVCLHILLCGDVVDDDAVDLAGKQVLNGGRAVVKADDVVIAVIIAAVDEAGGAALGADLLALEIIDALDVGAFLHDDDLHAVGVAVGKAHGVLTLGRDGHAGSDDIALAGLDGAQSRVKVHIVNDQFQTQLLRERISDLDIDTFKAGAFVALAVIRNGLIRRELCIGGHGEFPLGHGLKIRTRILLATGAQRCDHENCQKQCNKFLHFISLFLNKIDLDSRPVWYGRMIARQSVRVKDFLNVYSCFFFIYSLFQRIFTAFVNIPSPFCVFAQSDSTACLKD